MLKGLLSSRFFCYCFSFIIVIAIILGLSYAYKSMSYIEKEEFWSSLGSSDASRNAGLYYLSKISEEPFSYFENSVKMEDYLKKAASDGKPELYLALGDFYLHNHGNGFMKSKTGLQEARKYYNLAINANRLDTVIGGNYGLYLVGLLDNTPQEDMLKYLTIAASYRGDAALKLSAYYQQLAINNKRLGNKIEEEDNNSHSDYYLRLAANFGNTSALEILGNRYYSGSEDSGYEKNYFVAFSYYKLASNKSNNSKAKLAKMYEEGKGITQNFEEAKKLYGELCDKEIQTYCDEYRRLNELLIKH